MHTDVLGIDTANLVHRRHIVRAIRHAAVAAMLAVGLIVATAILAGAALAVVVAMVATVIPILVLPVLVIRYDEDETHDRNG